MIGSPFVRGKPKYPKQRAGLRVGRRGRLILFRNGKRITDRDLVLAAVGRKV